MRKLHKPGTICVQTVWNEDFDYQKIGDGLEITLAEFFSNHELDALEQKIK